MSTQIYSIQKSTLFSESLIWQINQDFYHQNGISAWTSGVVPHKITNSSLAATTYAELIYAFLKDLANNGQTEQTVYLLELGAGHGRLCFNILEHLDRLVSEDEECTTPYCYVLSDIVEENLVYYDNHPRLQEYIKRGILDISFFDGTESEALNLRKSKKTIRLGELDQPILTIANYFLDSLPNELFYIQDKTIFECSIALDTTVNPVDKSPKELLEELDLTYHKLIVKDPVFENKIYNEILSQYGQLESDSYVLFPKTALECLANISALSKAGLLLLTMDKGYKEIQELKGMKVPDIVKHGSFSLWVNFHAISQFCIKNGGVSFLDPSTNFSIELGCFFFSKQVLSYPQFEQAYQKHSKQINLDDFNSIKKLIYRNLPKVNLSELLGFIKLSSYDSAIFINLLPAIKHLSKRLSNKQRERLGQTIDQVWIKHYAIEKDYDFSYELGGLMYDLGFYKGALNYFQHSTDSHGLKVDVYYNQILCYYQLHEDVLFYKTLNEAKLNFPNTDLLLSLDKLEMG